MAHSVQKRIWGGWKAAVALTVALRAVSVAAAAEEPPVAPPPVPAVPADQLPEKPAVSTSSLDSDFVIDDNGRRDPFTFTKNIAVPIDSQIASVNQDGDSTEVKIPGLADEVVKKKKSAAELACNTAEAFLMELDPNSAIAKTDQGMEEFKDVPELFKYPELEVVKGRLLRARKASEQIRSRQTAQRDFDSMKIQISGVMAQKKNSQAIINSEIVHKGSMVKSSSEQADVMVDEILPERVVFVFRGYRMMLLLSDAGGK